MGTIAYTVPQAGTDLNSIADAEIATALTTIKTWANGNVDKANLASAVAAQIPTFGAALPGGPVDGQEFELQVDATNGVVWRFRYRSGSASTYKWEFIGGPPLYSEVLTDQSTTSTTYAALATAGPSITLPTLPNGGDFDVTIGAVIDGSSTGTSGFMGGFMSYDIGATAASDPNAIQAFLSVGTGFADASVSRTRRQTGLASAVALVAKYKLLAGTGTGNNVDFQNRYMSVLPVRVG